MGLFGFNAEKKIAQARRQAADGKLYDALRSYEEVAERADQAALREAAESEARDIRTRMIEARVEEADAFEAAGDLVAAKDRLQTALDLAGDDLPRERLDERLRAIESPRRPTRVSPEAPPQDLLPDPEEDPHRGAIRAEPTDPHDLYGEDPEQEFEMLMHTLDPNLVALYQQQGEPFRLGFLALTRGAPRAAIEQFDRMDWDPLPPAPVAFERARALLLARRAEEALELADRIEDAGPAGRWLRVEALRDLGRVDDAVVAATELVNAQPANTLESDTLLAWTLIEAGRPEEAYEHLEGWLDRGLPKRIAGPAAQALSMLERGERPPTCSRTLSSTV
ncbi:MAG: hypothetical protein R3E12_11665 [Candidatus Eisenbacteria bacterium]